ncbi:MAG: hypothetical protein U9R58_02095 [Chloroflexota bacterium]|nr:hypothetical protein [Chloroflexota bacterium]
MHQPRSIHDRRGMGLFYICPASQAGAMHMKPNLSDGNYRRSPPGYARRIRKRAVF